MDYIYIYVVRKCIIMEIEVPLNTIDLFELPYDYLASYTSFCFSRMISYNTDLSGYSI